MAKRLMIVAAAVLGVLVLAASATGTPSAASRSTALSAAPFAQAWANVPRTPAGRRAKDVLVFGMEQDITGFNTGLTCCGSFWAAVMGNVPEMRGAYNIDNKLRHVLDLVASAKATKTSLTYVIRKDANWNWGGASYR